jgi:hypothetical protein
MEYSSATKNEISSFTGKWMELESIMLIEVSQVQTDNDHIFSLMCGRQIRHKYKHYKYIYTHTYTEDISKSRTVREE